VGDNATVGDNAIVGNNAWVGDNATVGDNVWVGDNATVGYNATVGDGVKAKCIQFIGSKHNVYYRGEDKIEIGCRQHEIDYWQQNYARIGTIEGYTEQEIEEYGRYITIISEQHKLNQP
jgi:UDP-3-O-[3-hydroxymyristoyl] glucosamine N-acyltransferase